MVKFNFRGLMAPVFTPFNYDSERSLNLSLISKYAEFLKGEGVDGILGKTVGERERTAEAWVKAAKVTGQTIMIQVGGTNLPDVRRLAQHAEKLGAGAILCLADLFHQPKNAKDLLMYLKEVGSAAPQTPLFYYHIPGFTGIDINMQEMLELAENKVIDVPTLAGLKFTCNDLNMGSSLLKYDAYTIFLGSDTILSAAFCLGFDSAIGTTLNMFPKWNKTIVDSIKSSNIKSAQNAQKKLSNAVWTISKQGSWVGSMKSMMRVLTDIDVGPVREPLVDLTLKQVEEIRSKVL